MIIGRRMLLGKLISEIDHQSIITINLHVFPPLNSSDAVRTC